MASANVLCLLTVSLLFSTSSGDNGEFMVYTKFKQLIAVAVDRTFALLDDCD